MKKILVLLIAVLMLGTYVEGQHKNTCQHFKRGQVVWNKAKNMPLDTRSDSINILQENLFFDFIDLDGELRAYAELFIEAKVDGITNIELDLLGLIVDSVKNGVENYDFEYDGEKIDIDFPTILDIGDNINFTVYYQGEPVTDESGFGGFYFSGDYAYNIGVAFADDPHNYGRTWFPCFDNFVERFGIEFQVLTDSTHAAYCNGEFVSREVVGTDSILTAWILEEEIPSYLVSIGVAKYVHAEVELSSIDGNMVPAYLIAQPEDTTNMKNSFQNLDIAFDTFESNYGAYQWNKVGFNLVPFNSGAMEHSTNIAYPVSLANGSLGFQSLMAHELSHQWWGDLVTCRTAEDMWINEGMASYSVFLFFEMLEGFDSYRERVRENHKDVIMHAHESDGARLAISGIGHENTYGDHVYNKGADVGHNLRTYLGDDYQMLMASFLEEYKFKDVSSIDFRDFLVANTDADMISFFDNWVFAPGYPEFGVNYFNSAPNGELFDIQVLITQRLHYAPDFYENVPMKIRVMDAEFNFEDFDVNLEGETNEIFIQSTIDPFHVFLNPLDELSQAVLSEIIETEETGDVFMNYSEFRLELDEIGEGNDLWMLVENHLSDPDPYELDDEYNLSDDRYWKFRTVTDHENIDLGGRIYFYGNELAGTYIDEKFFANFESLTLNEDSLVLVYRSDATQEWSEYSDYEINTQGSNTNWNGYIRINNIVSGDYAWSYRWDSAIGIDDLNGSTSDLYYNAQEETINSKNISFSSYEIFSSDGRLVEAKSSACSKNCQISVKHLQSGSYIFISKENSQNLEVLKFVK